MKYKALFLGSFLGLLAFAGVSNASAQTLTISGTGVSNVTQSAATINWTTSTSSDTQVFYGTSTAYGLASALATATTTSHTVILDSLTASTTYHFMAQSKDVSGNIATSSDYMFTTLAPDVTAPVISAIAVSGITNTAAQITWTTNEPADTQADYGTTTSYGLSSALATATTTVHTVSLSSLTASTTYHFIVKSRDVTGNLATSTDQTFTTLVTSVTPPTATTTADILARLKVEPRTLNARSRGKWIEAEMTFPSNGYTAADVNASSIKLNGALSPDRVKAKNKRRGSTITLEMKFSRQALIDLLAGTATSTQSTASTTPTILTPSYQSVNVTVTGAIGSKTFGGSTTLRVMTWTPKPVPAPIVKKEKHEEERGKAFGTSHSPWAILPQIASTTQTTVAPAIKNIMKSEKGKEKKEEKSKKQEKREKGREGRD